MLLSRVILANFKFFHALGVYGIGRFSQGFLS
ncbi:MAG: hypothetical protein FD188_3543, partial [Ignavibacteria bacterium]